MLRPSVARVVLHPVRRLLARARQWWVAVPVCLDCVDGVEHDVFCPWRVAATDNPLCGFVCHDRDPSHTHRIPAQREDDEP